MKTRYRLMLFPLMAATACAFFGALETNLAMRSSSEPEKIALRDLIARGPEGNPNIILTDFKILGNFSIEKKAITRKWTKVWVPVVPADTPDSDTQTPIRVVLFSDEIRSEKQVYERFAKPQLAGLIDPESAKPALSAAVFGKRKLPDLKNCIVIVEGKGSAGLLKLSLLWVGCAVFLLMAGGVLYLAAKLDQIPEPAKDVGQAPA